MISDVLCKKSKRRKTFGNIAAGTFKLEKVTDSDHAG